MIHLTPDGQQFRFIKAVTVEYQDGTTTTFKTNPKRMSKKWRTLIDKFHLWRFVTLVAAENK
jgi:hypothetical protein